MFRVALCVLAFVAAVFSQCTSPADAPKTYTSLVTQTNGTENSFIIGQLAFDSSKGSDQIRFDITNNNGRQTEATYLLTGGKAYIIAGGRCSEIGAPAPYPAVSVQYFGENILGASLVTHTWNLFDANGALHQSVTLSDTKCVPVSTYTPPSFLQLFYNFTNEVRPGAFDVPAICQHAQPVDMVFPRVY